MRGLAGGLAGGVLWVGGVVCEEVAVRGAGQWGYGGTLTVVVWEAGVCGAVGGCAGVPSPCGGVCGWLCGGGCAGFHEDLSGGGEAEGGGGCAGAWGGGCAGVPSPWWCGRREGGYAGVRAGVGGRVGGGCAGAWGGGVVGVRGYPHRGLAGCGVVAVGVRGGCGVRVCVRGFGGGCAGAWGCAAVGYGWVCGAAVGCGCACGGLVVGTWVRGVRGSRWVVGYGCVRGELCRGVVMRCGELCGGGCEGFHEDLSGGGEAEGGGDVGVGG